VKLGARVSVIVAVTQELVSTPSCFVFTAKQAWLGIIHLGLPPNSPSTANVKELFLVTLIN